MQLSNVVSLFVAPKILIVDDNQANLIALAAILESLAVEVVRAESGNAALQLLLDNEFSMVLLDVQMPEMDGYEVASLMRSFEGSKDTPIIFLTAVFRGEEYQKKGYDVGAVDYLEKPINTDFLLSKVRIFLDLYNKNKQLEHLQRKTEITLSAIPDPVFTVNGDNILYMNDAAKLLAHAFSAPPGVSSLTHLFGFSQDNLQQIELLVSCIDKELNQQGSMMELSFTSPDTANNYVYEFRVVPLQGMNASHSEVILIFHDISNLRSLSQELSYQAFHDPLTGLYNRRYLEDTFEKCFIRYKRHKRHLALMLIDLDDFKKINDSAGHHAGDEALRFATRAIQSCLRDVDTLCRIGGDEFCILFEEVASLESLEIPAQRIIKTLSEPFEIDAAKYQMGASIGIASTFNVEVSTAAEMLSDADMAMYAAKDQGKNDYTFFDQSMRHQRHDKLRLDKELMNAVSESEFCLYYQPQINIKTGMLNGFEALIRWRHPEKGIINPGDFLDALESSGLIKNVGQWVIEEACRQIAQWQKMSFDVPCVSVNVSPRQFEQPNFPDIVRSALKSNGVEAQQLGIEITETLFMETTLLVENNLRALHEMGCKISLDDFGTGYSALSYLLRFPIDVIKIDQSFTMRMVSQPQIQEMVSAIIRMAQGFNGMEVISEGVDKIASLTMLTEMGCDSYQGFLFSRPVEASEAQKRLPQSVPKRQLQ